MKDTPYYKKVAGSVSNEANQEPLIWRVNMPENI